MKKLFLFSITIFSLTLNAAPPVTYQFTNGTTIEASQVNANYQELADRIEVLQNQVNTMKSNAQMSLVGFTTALTSNNNGEFTKLSQLCYAEFADSRICNIKEALETVNPPALGASEKAWVMSNGVIAVSAGSGSISILDSIIGVGSTNCLSFNSTGKTSGACNGTDQYRVACCR